MSEEVQVNKSPTGWVKLWHPIGVQVSLPVSDIPVNYKSMFDNVSAAVEAGWLVNAPGVNPGENRLEVGGIVHREHQDKKTGEVIPVIDLYSVNERAIYCQVTVYLNKKEDVEAFEYASGMKLDSIPIYEGTNKISRGTNVKTDAKIIKPPKPFVALWVDNPRYDEKEAKECADKKEIYPVAKRLLARWESSKPVAKQEDFHEYAIRIRSEYEALGSDASKVVEYYKKKNWFELTREELQVIEKKTAEKKAELKK